MLLRSSAFLLTQGLCLISAALAATTTTSSNVCTPTTQTISGRTCNLSCGTDRPGGDFSSVRTSSINGCIQACATEARCLTAQYVESSGYCYLKNLVSQAAAAEGVDTVDCSTATASSCTPLTTTVSGRSCTISCGQDRPGGDYQAIQANSLNACVSACASDQQCTDAQYRQSTNFCYLKNTITDPTAAADVSSVVCNTLSIDTSSDIDNCGAIGKQVSRQFLPSSIGFLPYAPSPFRSALSLLLTRAQ